MKVLHAIHDFLPLHRAGSEIYAFNLCRELSREHQVEVLCAEYDPQRAHGSITHRSHQGLSVHEMVNNWAFGSFAETYSSPRLNTSLARVLDQVRPDLLHLHNLLNLSFDLPSLAWARGIPSVATLHDYTLVCPSGGQRVHLAEEHVCLQIDPKRCARCFAQSPFHAQMAFGALSSRPGLAGPAASLGRSLRQRFPGSVAWGERALGAVMGSGVSPSDITRRLKAVQQVFEAVELFVAPSKALGEEYIRLGIPEKKLRVSDYGFVPLQRAIRAPARLPLKIGFVGTLAWHKGAHVLLEAVRRLPPDQYSVQLFGDLRTFPAYVERLRRAAQGLPVQLRGGFDNGQASDIYAGLDVLVVSSLWPENSPLVIHEAFQSGLPVVGARMGGIVDLISDQHNGLLYEARSPSSLSLALNSLLQDPGLLDRFREALPPVKSLTEDAAEWTRLYAEVSRADFRARAQG